MSETMMTSLKSRYRAGRDNLGEDFFAPCLNQSCIYKRAAGYFSSSALVTWANALPRLVQDNHLAIQLLISPEISEADKNALLEACGDDATDVIEGEAIDLYLNKALDFADDPLNHELRLELFAWLLEQGKIQLRFVFTDHSDVDGIYHEKFGVFENESGEKVGFIGSANESLQAHRSNGEFVMVFRSWIEQDIERIEELEVEFDEAWDGLIPGMRVYPLSEDLVSMIVTRCRAGAAEVLLEPTISSRPPPWPHQKIAIDTFLIARNGLLEMATGTGKTRTALEIALSLITDNKIDSVIVATDGNDLLQQWYLELLEWRRTDNLWRRVFRNFDKNHENDAFLMNPRSACLVASSSSLGGVLGSMSVDEKSRTLVIHDEVHGLGSPGKRNALSGKHENMGWKLGLSATPERTYDDEGNQFIEQEIGPILYRYEIGDAISDGILCPFEYKALPYLLTEGDKKRLQNVWSMKAARAREGKPMTSEEVAIAISNVYKTAEEKPKVFEDFLASNPGCLRNSIIFVETREYGEEVLSLVQAHTLNYKTYYSEDETHYLAAFARGELDCLITCHKLSQGIDIPHLENVILFSSAKAKLETIQRIGRCLRLDRNNPSKVAQIVDFCLEDLEDEDNPTNPDSGRYEWLRNLSQIRPKR